MHPCASSSYFSTNNFGNGPTYSTTLSISAVNQPRSPDRAGTGVPLDKRVFNVSTSWHATALCTEKNTYGSVASGFEGPDVAHKAFATITLATSSYPDSSQASSTTQASDIIVDCSSLHKVDCSCNGAPATKEAWTGDMRSHFRPQSLERNTMNSVCHLVIDPEPE